MDLKVAIRSLLARPAFTALAIFILALGIGANTAIFSVLHRVVLRPLPYARADRLVTVTRTWKQFRFGQQSGPDFVDYRASSQSFAAMAACTHGVENVVTNRYGAFTGVSAVSEDFFRVFSVVPSAGHLLSREKNTAVVNQAFWQRRFSGERWTPGKKLTADNKIFDIVGVVPASFHFPEDSQTEVWIPHEEELATTHRTANNYRVVGRLQDGIRVETAQSEMSAVAGRIARTFGKPGVGVLLTPLSAFNTRNIRPVLYILFGAVLLVLLIACVNVANLLLARGADRLREFSIRAALGASFGQLTRQLLLESLLLSLFGCALGMVLASVSLPALLLLAPQNLSGLENAGVSLPVVLFAIAVSLAATVLCGVAPALQAAYADPTEGIRSGAGKGSIGGKAARTHRYLVTAEIALCMVLLASSGLLLRSLSGLLKIDLGFRPEHVLAAEISADIDAGRSYTSFYKPLLARLRGNSIYGSVALSRDVPGNGNYLSDGSYVVSGQTEKDFNLAAPQAGFHVVSPNYFQAIGIPFVNGRDFNERDSAASENVALVNQSLARRSFPKGDAVGRRLLCGFDLLSMKWMTIVGVVRDARLAGPGVEPGPEIFMPFAQHPRPDGHVLLRPVGDAMNAAAPLQALVRELNPSASTRFKLLTDNLTESVAVPKFIGTLVSLFAGLAAVLAAAGIYGLMNFSVTRRTSEIGLRMALGASRGSVLRLILTAALKLTAAGFVLGLFGSFVATNLIKTQLFQVSLADPLTYFLALAVIVLIGLVASWLPAYRAARVEPLTALRQE